MIRMLPSNINCTSVLSALLPCWRQDIYAKAFNADQVGEILTLIRELLWPDGVFMEETEELTEEMEDALLRTVRERLDTVVPGTAASLLGHDVTKRGIWKIHEFCQCEVLLKNLVYTIFDLLVLKLFPEIDGDRLITPPQAPQGGSMSSGGAGSGLSTSNSSARGGPAIAGVGGRGDANGGRPPFHPPPQLGGEPYSGGGRGMSRRRG